MVRPSNFGFNPETADSNAFQTNDGTLTKKEISEIAVEEFDNAVELLASKGIDVKVFQDSSSPFKTDAVFPNNWITTHQDGTLMTYPMYSPNRRLERVQEISDYLMDNFKVNRDYTLAHYEDDDLFLEGTGSMILDRINKIVYACLGPRTSIEILNKWCVIMEYRKCNFTALDRAGIPIYHTNVMMSLGSDIAVVCLESIADENERKQLIKLLAETNKLLVDIKYEQMENFAGNMLQVLSRNGDKYMVMSQTAYNSLTDQQKSTIAIYNNILPIKIDIIEKYGGGSVRCMIAENFLPSK
jgi:hypothetical protein